MRGLLTGGAVFEEREGSALRLRGNAVSVHNHFVSFGYDEGIKGVVHASLAARKRLLIRRRAAASRNSRHRDSFARHLRSGDGQSLEMLRVLYTENRQARPGHARQREVSAVPAGHQAVRRRSLRGKQLLQGHSQKNQRPRREGGARSRGLAAGRREKAASRELTANGFFPWMLCTALSASSEDA